MSKTLIQIIEINSVENAENILKSIDFENDIFEKAVAQIGEIRKWSDGTYKKIDNGKWVKIIDGKEKSIATSTMNKIIKTLLEEKAKETMKLVKEFENSLKTDIPKWKIEYKVFLEKEIKKGLETSEYYQKIINERKDLYEELKQITTLIEKEKKRKREEKVGKKELDIDEVEKIIKEINNVLEKTEKIPNYVTAKQAIPEVTIDNYYLHTETNFDSIEIDGGLSKVLEKWEKMKEDKNLEFHKSPKSSSEYLINEKTGDIYRLSDHWGIVATCRWYIEDKESINDTNWSIKKSNIKDFKRRDEGNYLNPIYREANLSAAKKFLPKLKNLLDENKKFYLTEKARKLVLNKIESIYKKLYYYCNVDIESINKMKKEYETY